MVIRAIEVTTMKVSTILGVLTLGSLLSAAAYSFVRQAPPPAAPVPAAAAPRSAPVVKRAPNPIPNPAPSQYWTLDQYQAWVANQHQQTGTTATPPLPQQMGSKASALPQAVINAQPGTPMNGPLPPAW